MARKTVRADEWLLGRFKRRFSKRQWAALFGGNPVLFGGAAPNPLFAGVTCPAITPTLGDELLANPGFEGTYDDESGGGGGTVNVAPDWNLSLVETDGTDTLDKELTVIHGGSASQKIIVNATHEGVVTAANAFALGKWYQASFWLNRASGGGQLWGVDAATGSAISTTTLPVSGTGAWVQSIGTGRSTGNSAYIIKASVSFNGYIDDASVKEITLASMLTSLGTVSARDGTYICHPTVADKTQAGMAIAYLNATTFVLADVDRAQTPNTAKLLKLIGGTWTSVISGNITYSAAAELKVVVSGQNYGLFYNGAQVGTAQVINNTLGLDVYGFNAYAGNSVGVVSANP